MVETRAHGFGRDHFCKSWHSKSKLFLQKGGKKLIENLGRNLEFRKNSWHLLLLIFWKSNIKLSIVKCVLSSDKKWKNELLVWLAVPNMKSGENLQDITVHDGCQSFKWLVCFSSFPYSYRFVSIECHGNFRALWSGKRVKGKYHFQVNCILEQEIPGSVW